MSRSDHQEIDLVLLPGLDGTAKFFDSFATGLPKSIRTHSVAYPSDKPRSLTELAQLVAGRLPSESTVILAESFSGLVALSLLAQRKVDVRAVIFCASFAEPPRPFLLRFAPLAQRSAPLIRSLPAFILRQFCLGTEASAEQLAYFREVLAQVPPPIIAHRLGLIGARHSFMNTRFDVPCFYLQATNDRLVPDTASRWFSQHFKSFQLERIDGPHFLLQAKPLGCSERVAKILESL